MEDDTQLTTATTVTVLQGERERNRTTKSVEPRRQDTGRERELSWKEKIVFLGKESLLVRDYILGSCQISNFFIRRCWKFN